MAVAFGVPSTLRVASPPAKAVMIYDGDCHFCSLWVHRWQVVSAGHLDFLPLQDPSAAQRFPEIPRSQLEQVRAGTLTAYEWWHAFQPERVNEQAEYYERLAKSKQDEIAPHLAELERIKAGDLTPPADNPNPPADPGANP